MLRKLLASLCLVAPLAVSASPALAQPTLATPTSSMGCNYYSLSVQASDLTPGQAYAINYTINAAPSAAGFPITSSIAIPSSSDEGGTFSTEVTLFFPPLSGTHTFSGTATLAGTSYPISFSPKSEGCTAPPPPSNCTAQSVNQSNFNGTPIAGGDYIWFNANFTASGIPSSGTTITFTNSTITFGSGSMTYAITVPNAVITFSPTATCTSTTFTNETWTTTVPVKGDDEIFLTGLSWPVPAGGLPGGINPVTWTGTFGTNGGQVVQWKWGAAVYSPNFTQDYPDLAPKPGHQTACNMNNGDHAGCPEGDNSFGQPLMQFLVGGARGGGGSNCTGSWSGTTSVAPTCQ
jgi:hypothetical protein